MNGVESHRHAFVHAASVVGSYQALGQSLSVTGSEINARRYVRRRQRRARRRRHDFYLDTGLRGMPV